MKCNECGAELPPPASATQRYVECAQCGARNDMAASKTLVSGSAPTPASPRGFSAKGLVGKSLDNGKYKLIKILGEGGMGVVYLGQQTSLNRAVAVKVLSSELTHDQDFVERFKREALIVAKFANTPIVPVIDTGTEGDLHYIVMPFVAGPGGRPTSLRDVMRKERLELKAVLNIMVQACSALDHAHRSGIIHRDVKPGNFLLDEKGRVFLADFGIASTRAYAQSGLTIAGGQLGTLHYMSPEQVKDPSTVDARSDLYCLGVIFHELLTGDVPDATSPPPSKVRRDADSRLDRIVYRALQRDPDKRYQTAGEMGRDILAVRDGRKGSRASAGVWLAAAILVLAVLGGAGVAAYKWQGGPATGAGAATREQDAQKADAPPAALRTPEEVRKEEVDALLGRVDALAESAGTIPNEDLWPTVREMRREIDATEPPSAREELHRALDMVIAQALELEASKRFARASACYEGEDFDGAKAACREVLEVYARLSFPELRVLPLPDSQAKTEAEAMHRKIEESSAALQIATARKTLDGLTGAVGRASSGELWRQVEAAREQIDAIKLRPEDVERLGAQVQTLHEQVDGLILQGLEAEASKKYDRAYKCYERQDYRHALEACEEARDDYYNSDPPAPRRRIVLETPPSQAVGRAEALLAEIGWFVDPSLRFTVTGVMEAHGVWTAFLNDNKTGGAKRGIVGDEIGDRMGSFRIMEIDGRKHTITIRNCYGETSVLRSQ